MNGAEDPVRGEAPAAAPVVVAVGADGSPAAVQHGVEEALRRGLGLHLVHATRAGADAGRALDRALRAARIRLVRPAPVAGRVGDMRCRKPTYAVPPKLLAATLAAGLAASLTACGSETPDTASDGPTASATPTPGTSPSLEPTRTSEPTPSVDPEPAVVEGLDLDFTRDALTMTLRVPDLVATDRLLVLYRWQTRDVRVAVETTLVGDEPVLNAVWSDGSAETSGKVKDVDAAWDLDAGTVTITLRERLNGTQAEVSALGLGPRDRYPVEPPPYAVTERVQRR